MTDRDNRDSGGGRGPTPARVSSPPSKDGGVQEEEGAVVLSQSALQLLEIAQQGSGPDKAERSRGAIRLRDAIAKEGKRPAEEVNTMRPSEEPAKRKAPVVALGGRSKRKQLRALSVGAVLTTTWQLAAANALKVGVATVVCGAVGAFQLSDVPLEKVLEAVTGRAEAPPAATPKNRANSRTQAPSGPQGKGATVARGSLTAADPAPPNALDSTEPPASAVPKDAQETTGARQATANDPSVATDNTEAARSATLTRPARATNPTVAPPRLVRQLRAAEASPQQSTPPPQPAPVALAAEAQTLSQVNRLLRKGQHSEALSLLNNHSPSALAVEWRAARAIALCGSGSAQGPASARRFLQRHGNSPLTARVRRDCGVQ